MLAPVLVTAASEDVVTLDEAKRHLRVDFDEDDQLITGLIAAATRHLEQELGMALAQQEWRQDLPRFADKMRLRPGPVDLASVSLDYRDEAGAEQSLAGSVYRTHADAEGAYVRIASGESWPATYDREDAVSISFTAGVAAEDVPADLKVAILLHMAFLYEKRESHSDTNITPTGAYDMLLWNYRRPKV
jgi:uncharacterized phiE125 gp8 family phage protein